MKLFIIYKKVSTYNLKTTKENKKTPKFQKSFEKLRIWTLISRSNQLPQRQGQI